MSVTPLFSWFDTWIFFVLLLVISRSGTWKWSVVGFISQKLGSLGWGLGLPYHLESGRSRLKVIGLILVCLWLRWTENGWVKANWFYRSLSQVLIRTCCLGATSKAPSSISSFAFQASNLDFGKFLLIFFFFLVIFLAFGQKEICLILHRKLREHLAIFYI